MSYYMAPRDDSLMYPTGDDLYANMQVGSDGNTDGDPSIIVGDDQGEENWTWYDWDSSYSGSGSSFDSGNVFVNFTASTNGSESLTVGSASPVDYDGDSIDSISAVDIQAAVTVPAEAMWSDITVKFYNGGTLEETIDPPSGPSVNTTNTPSSPQQEQILTVTPDESGITSVSVSGTMRMIAPSTTTPGSTGMFCNIYILGSHGSLTT